MSYAKANGKQKNKRRGTQVYAADANGDGKPDIVVGNKRGTAVLLSEKSSAKK